MKTWSLLRVSHGDFICAFHQHLLELSCKDGSYWDVKEESRKKESLNPCLGWSSGWNSREWGIVVANGTKVKKNKSEKLEKPQELVYRYRHMTGKKAEKLNKQSNGLKFKIEAAGLGHKSA